MSIENQDSNNKYQRISCGVYDKLEGFATLNKEVLITYEKEGVVFQEQSRIRTFETKNKEEFLITLIGTRIRLDWIDSVLEV